MQVDACVVNWNEDAVSEAWRRCNGFRINGAYIGAGGIFLLYFLYTNPYDWSVVLWFACKNNSSIRFPILRNKTELPINAFRFHTANKKNRTASTNRYFFTVIGALN